jgi:hypothetical protein
MFGLSLSHVRVRFFFPSFVHEFRCACLETAACWGKERGVRYWWLVEVLGNGEKER